MSYLLAAAGHAYAPPLEWGSGMCFMWGRGAALVESLSQCVDFVIEKPPRADYSQGCCKEGPRRFIPPSFLPFISQEKQLLPNSPFASLTLGNLSSCFRPVESSLLFLFSQRPELRHRLGLSCSCFRCDNDALSPGPPTLTKVFHNTVGSCCHSCGLGSGSLGLLLGTWAGLFPRQDRGDTGSLSPLSLERRWGSCLDLEEVI